MTGIKIKPYMHESTNLALGDLPRLRSSAGSTVQKSFEIK